MSPLPVRSGNLQIHFGEISTPNLLSSLPNLNDRICQKMQRHQETNERKYCEQPPVSQTHKTEAGWRPTWNAGRVQVDSLNGVYALIWDRLRRLLSLFFRIWLINNGKSDSTLSHSSVVFLFICLQQIYLYMVALGSLIANFSLPLSISQRRLSTVFFCVRYMR